MSKIRPKVYTLIRYNFYGLNFLEAHAYSASELGPLLTKLKQKLPKSFFKIEEN